jgi:hypothetical protein
MSFKPDSRLRIDFDIKQNAANLIAGLGHWQQLDLLVPDPIRLEVTGHDLKSETLRVNIELPLKQAQFLQGLAAWQDLGLLDNAQMRGQVWVSSSHPALMAGLEEWAQLGLLSQASLLQLGQTHLACASQVVLKQSAQPVSTTAIPASKAPPSQGTSPSFVPAVPVRPKPPPEPTWLVRMLRSLMAELSVIWLLALGVVLVLLSSSVLVANQWNRFAPAGQYGILWAYTLAFGGATLWASHHPNLRMTAKALTIVSLLLVPLNFIAMDEFGLWHRALDMGVLLLAAFSLGTLSHVLLRLPVLGQIPSKLRRRCWYQYLWLSLLHWGWGLTWMPVLAIYLGILGIAWATLSRPGALQMFPAANSPSLPPHREPRWRDLEPGLVGYGLGLLFIRALVGAQVPLPQFGLAIGMSGFLLAWVAFRRISSEVTATTADTKPTEPSSTAGAASGRSGSADQIHLSHLILPQLSLVAGEVAGLALLLVGWGLTVATLPWQAMGVSLLALLLFARRLLHTWYRDDLAVLLLIGLQVIWLGWAMLPDAGQQYASDLGERLVGSQGQPWAALSLVIFPYGMAIVALSDWLARHRQRDLARFSGWLVLGLGLALAGLGALNPTLRGLNLLASTLLLAMVTRRRWRQWVTRQIPRAPSAPQRITQLATLTHVAALLTLAAVVVRVLPSLTFISWAIVSLVVMVAEWGFSLGPTTVDFEQPNLSQGLTRLLRQSAWPLCLVAAGLTLTSLYTAAVLSGPSFDPRWGAMGLAVPPLLTAMAAQMPARRPLSPWLSTVGLVLLPPCSGLTHRPVWWA